MPPVPRGLSPMLATAGPLPIEDGRWSYEVKWDGVRVLVSVQGGRVHVASRSGRDVTGAYPELSGLAAALPGDALLDAEVVAFDPGGLPDFGLLQSRMHVVRPGAALVRQVPVTLVVFDLLHHGGRDLLDAPYDERRSALDALGCAGPHWQVPPAFDEGGALLTSTLESGLEGVVAKRRDSTYEPGRRSGCWVKVKHVHHQSAVVVGWQPGEGGRAGQLGSLLLAVQGEDGLVFAGHVGTGFSQAELRRLGTLLQERAVDAPPVQVPRDRARAARWVRPDLVAEVAFTSWTREGRLRHPSYAGLRDDVDPASVVRGQRGGPR